MKAGTHPERKSSAQRSGGSKKGHRIRDPPQNQPGSITGYQSGGGAALLDTPPVTAEGKNSKTIIGSRTAKGAKVERSGTGSYGEVEGGESLQVGDTVAGGVDRAILSKWHADAVGIRAGIEEQLTAPGTESRQQVEEEDVGADVYDDDVFEQYSDEFDSDKGSDNGQGPQSLRRSEMGAMEEMRRNLEAPDQDEQALKEIQHSLRQENMAARERQASRPSHASKNVAEGKDGESQPREVKGAKGSRSSASLASARGTGSKVAPRDASKGTFSDMSAAPPKTHNQPRSSSFKMADSTSLSKALGKGDPRMQRNQAIRAGIQLESERRLLLDLPPATPLDLYHRRLRARPAHIRQLFTQTNEDRRSVASQTDEIVRLDQEAQFQLGHDDTELENLMARMRLAQGTNRGRGSGSVPSQASCPSPHKVDPYSYPETHDWDRGDGTTLKSVFKRRAEGGNSEVKSMMPGEVAAEGSEPMRLNRFLAQASVVMEALCEENVRSRGGRGGTNNISDDENDDAGTWFLSARKGSGWEVLGGAARTGLWTLIGAYQVVGVAFSRANRSMLITAHGGVCVVNRDKMGVLEGYGVVCVWETQQANSVGALPLKVLVGEGHLTSLGIGLSQPHIVMAGTGEGSILLWDLREPAFKQLSEEAGILGLPCGLRTVTYTTASSIMPGTLGGDPSLPSTGHGHCSTVVSVVPIPSQQGGEEGVEAGKGVLGAVFSLSTNEVNTFQVASMDDRGVVSIWVVSQLGRPDKGGSQVDLGLSPVGRVRMALSKTLHSYMMAPSRFPNSWMSSSDTQKIAATDGKVGPYACGLSFCPMDPNRFIVATTTGDILHQSRLGTGTPTPTKAFRPPINASTVRRWGIGLKGGDGREVEPGHANLAGTRSISSRDLDGWDGGSVTCMSFSSFFRGYFLAGCSDGSARLYREDCSRPIATWEAFAGRGGGRGELAGGDQLQRQLVGVSSILWSDHRPSVFFALDSSGVVHGFDIMANDTRPVVSEPVPDLDSAVGTDSESKLGGGLFPHDACADEGKGGDGAKGGWETMVEKEGWAPPIMALSCDVLATGSRPRVVVGHRGRVFVLKLAGRLFRPSNVREGSAEENDRIERAWMLDWLESIL